MLRRGGCSGRWQRSRAACPRGDGRGTWAGWRQRGTHGRQLLSAPHGQATKDKFMGPRAALQAEHTGALWSWVRQGRAASRLWQWDDHLVLYGTTFARRMLPEAPGINFRGALFCSQEI